MSTRETAVCERGECACGPMTLVADGPTRRGEPNRASDQSDDMTGTNHSRPDHDEIAEAGLVSQVAMMSRGFWASRTRNAVALLAAGLFVVIAATAYGQIRLNSWNQPFYDALSRRDFPQFLVQLSVFGLIAGALLVLNVAQRWLGEMLKLKIRQGLVQDLVQNWLVPGRAHRIANAGDIGVNPDQRMHEDARHLTELSADLGIGLLQGSILLVSFINILWGISSGCVFHFAGRTLAIPGYLVWAAFIYAASASLVSFWLGRSLIERNAERYAREADLRFSLVRVNEHIDAIALAGGEAEEARRIELDLEGVLLGDAPARHWTHESILGHRRIRLVHARGADSRGGAALFCGYAVFRRPDDGVRRIRAGSILAALVRRQCEHSRRLARDITAGC